MTSNLQGTGVAYTVTSSSGNYTIHSCCIKNTFHKDCFVDLDVSIHDFMDESFNASDISDTNAIMLPPGVFTTIYGNDISIVFSMFNSSLLYPLTNKTFKEFYVASTVVSATIVDSEEVISANITIVLKLNIEVISNLYAH